MTKNTVYWHVTPSGQVRRCFAFDPNKREGRNVLAGCTGDDKMGCELHHGGDCPAAGYACGIDSEEVAREVAKSYRGG